jgi:serine/threonine-protein kinase HSL1 (negative regulator of Swe1 kinase)
VAFVSYTSKCKKLKSNIGFEIQDDSASIAESIAEEQWQSHVGRVPNFENPRTRQIEPQQNWLARLFHVKPAMRFICFSVSKRRARQEIASLLKEWRKYGAKDIVVDKERNIVFGRVGPRNCKSPAGKRYSFPCNTTLTFVPDFQMKEVAFASEILTVIEHGKRSPLSIARFTQEKGAASSFHKVVETLEIILKSRGMLVMDERKKRMIIKTLNAA